MIWLSLFYIIFFFNFTYSKHVSRLNATGLDDRGFVSGTGKNIFFGAVLRPALGAVWHLVQGHHGHCAKQTTELKSKMDADFLRACEVFVIWFLECNGTLKCEGENLYAVWDCFMVMET